MISIHLHSETELYNRFDRNHQRISGDFYRYLKECYEELPFSERRDCTIHLSCDTDLNHAVAEKVIQEAIDRDIQQIDKTLGINRAKMIRLYVIGLTLIAIGITLTVVLDQIALEVISIVGSMAIKDGATIMIENNPELRIHRKLLEQMKSIRII